VIKLEKGVPIPTKTRKIGRPFQYPWPEFGVGDSFSVMTKEEAWRGYKAARAYSNRNKLGWLIVWDKEASGYRVWRAA
jgi:hypothetical protein